jgi:hypothetical protein
MAGLIYPARVNIKLSRRTRKNWKKIYISIEEEVWSMMDDWRRGSGALVFNCVSLGSFQ